jgi:hypothetical protein
MIWLTWRQFRVQTLIVLAALLVLAGYLVLLGYQIRHAYQADIVGCRPDICERAKEKFFDTYDGQVGMAGALLTGAPALIGIFWGAPLITRELEEKTHRLVWNQSVTRTRWLATKLAFIALVALAVTGVLSLLLTWSASRYDQVLGDRFGALTFGARNLVPLGYAVFALVLGTVAGLLLRRTLPAMALTLVLVAAAQILVSAELRAHLMPPVTTTVAVDAAVVEAADGFSASETDGLILGYAVPGSWPMAWESQLFNPDGTPYTFAEARPCMMLGPAGKDCMAKLNLHFSYRHQPGSRYWPFQWIELSAFLGLAVLLAGFAFWRIRRQPG